MQIHILDFNLSWIDAQAIMASLPVIFAPEFHTPPQQADRNEALSESVIKKLSTADPKFSTNEVRVMLTAVVAAHQFLTGKLHLTINDDLKRELSRHFFTINKLAPGFSSALDTLVDMYMGT